MKRIASAFALVLAACSSGSSGTTSTATDSLVTNAVLQSQTTHTTTVDCFSTFKGCINSASTDAEVSDCQEALKSCLPPPKSVGADGVPDLCNPRPEHHRGDGHACDADGGMMPPPPPADVDGGVPPPPPPGGPGAGPGPGDGAGPRPPIPVGPDGRIALATCHAELDKCLAAGTDATTCTDTAHSCVHDALAADFKRLCDSVSTQCAACPTSKPCVDLTARCAAGLTLPEQAQ